MDQTPESSCISSEAPPPPPSTAASQLLEISLISAQDLAPVSKSMHTYGVVWIRPNKKHTTRTDNHGQRNPKWNDKCVFSLDNPPENNDATVTVEIYTVSWFRDVIVGMVRVRVADLITPLTRTRNKNTRFVALQIRRPSGSPQGILNMGVALSDTAMRSMPLSSKNHSDERKQNDDVTDLNIVLWRSLSAGCEAADDNKPGSACNGSDLCSDVGPSASVVAAELAKKPLSISNTTKKAAAAEADQETDDSSILEELTAEEAKAKGYKSVATSKEMWRRAMATTSSEGGGDESAELLRDGGGRRRSDDDDGRFSCFGNAYGIEFTIVCGAGKNPSRNNKRRSSCSRRTKKTISSKANSA